MKQLICFFGLMAMASSADLSNANLAGTWKFSVDLDSHEHGDPTFVLKQQGDKLSGTYEGPFGTQQVTGTVSGDKAHFEVSASGPGGSVKLTYEARVESPAKMSGTITRNINGDSTPGKWSATKK